MNTVKWMGDPCFEAMEMHHVLEQVEPVDRIYSGDTGDSMSGIKSFKKSENRK
jgi:hypothetical protein